MDGKAILFDGGGGQPQRLKPPPFPAFAAPFGSRRSLRAGLDVNSCPSRTVVKQFPFAQIWRRGEKPRPFKPDGGSALRLGDFAFRDRKRGMD